MAAKESMMQEMKEMIRELDTDQKHKLRMQLIGTPERRPTVKDAYLMTVKALVDATPPHLVAPLKRELLAELRKDEADTGGRSRRKKRKRTKRRTLKR